MGDLANCPRCNALFVKEMKDICQNCYKEEEKEFDKVYKYIRKQKNRTASIDQVSEDTGVDRDLIMKFVKEQRLRTSMFPNLSYPCERCESPISEGKLCGNCSQEIQSDLKKEEEIQNLNKVKESETRTYFNFKK